MNHSTECAAVANDDKVPSQSIRISSTTYVICKFMQNIPLARSNKHALSPDAVIGTLASGIILIAGVATAIIFMCVRKRKGNPLVIFFFQITTCTVLFLKVKSIFLKTLSGMNIQGIAANNYVFEVVMIIDHKVSDYVSIFFEVSRCNDLHHQIPLTHLESPMVVTPLSRAFMFRALGIHM